METTKRLINLLRLYGNQQCLLFVGAGFSAGAMRCTDNNEKLPIPAGYDLSQIMKNALSEESNDLGELADLYQEQFGDNGLFHLLKSLYVASEVNEAQKSICRYPWKEIYTTNFDNVLELCCAQQGIKFSTYTPLRRPIDVDHKSLPIIHINGFVPGSNFNDFLKEIKLTNIQYFSDDFSRSAWGNVFVMI
jgi:hypothetical protein